MIYLDHNATTPIDPSAAQAMKPFWESEYGNPSCDYELGFRAHTALNRARKQAADLIGASPEEIVFTSGATESNNTVLKSAFYRAVGKAHLITTRIEHPATMNPAFFLLSRGAEVTFLPVDGQGLVDPEEVRRAIRPETVLVSVILAHNETGVIQPIREIGRVTREHGVALHTDAAQALGKIPVDVASLGVDFLSVAGHKFYAPKGVGALYIRRGLEVEPLLHGAGQESGRRAGTENVLLGVGLGQAAQVAGELLPADGPRLKKLRDRLYQGLKEMLPDLVLVGHTENRLPNTLNICLPGLKGMDVLKQCPNIMASTGAACHAGEVKVSSVHGAMGLAPEVALGAIRLSLGRSNTPEQVEEAINSLAAAGRKLKK